MKNTIEKRSEELFWIFQYGTPKRKISHQKLLAQPDLIARPVFFLSTGRCGTKWFADILDLDRNVKANHEPVPTLSMQNLFVYRLWKNAAVPKEVKLEVMENIFTAGREQHLRYAYKTEKRYIETNNQLTFFAPGLAKMFPDARFVHLYRHPGEFVRSGIRRGWFDTNKSATLKIIKPESNSRISWDHYSQIQKISWVWKETNEFIEEFMNDLDENRKMKFDFNQKSLISIKELVDFLDLDISEKTIEAKMDKKVNRQKVNEFPRYENWTDDQKMELKEICGELADKYQYAL